jgi:polar amino acid transport system substrate-binding protein
MPARRLAATSAFPAALAGPATLLALVLPLVLAPRPAAGAPPSGSPVVHPLASPSSAPARAKAPAPPPATTATPRAITVCSDPWMPYAGSGVPGADEGYVLAVTREALRRGGLEIRYVAIPWSRCLADVEAGRWDAIACADLHEAKGVVYPEQPVGLNGPAIFTLAGSTWRYGGVASLERLRIGAVQGYTFTDEIDGWLAAHAKDGQHLYLAAGSEPLRRLMEMLAAGRLDAIVENSLVAAWTAHQAGRPPGFLRDAGASWAPVPIYVAFSSRRPDAAALARAFDAGILAMRADGTLARLLARYQIAGWGPPEAHVP